MRIKQLPIPRMDLPTLISTYHLHLLDLMSWVHSTIKSLFQKGNHWISFWGQIDLWIGKNMQKVIWKKCTSTGESNLIDTIFYDSVTIGPCRIIHTLSSLLKRSIFSTHDRSNFKKWWYINYLNDIICKVNVPGILWILYTLQVGK